MRRFLSHSRMKTKFTALILQKMSVVRPLFVLFGLWPGHNILALASDNPARLNPDPAVFVSAAFPSINGNARFILKADNDTSNNGHANKLKPKHIKTPSDEHSANAQKMFNLHPKLFPEERRASILAGVVLQGMTPLEARLAAGAFFYKVIADKSIWPEHYHPLEVIDAQSWRPDDSEIWMTFRNDTQFEGPGERRFRVYFRQGRALRIEELGE